jgi:ubiquitin-protein ligase
MWTTEQRQRLYIEHETLQREGFSQFSVYHDKNNDTYYASGYATSSSGRLYGLYIRIPNGYPHERPMLYVTDPLPLLMCDGRTLVSLGMSHYMHTLEPSSNGMAQICHWRESRWHSGILLLKVFLKGHLWIEAYEQHLATGRNLSEFVGTMTEIA